MKFQIIADSCLDYTPAIKQSLELQSAPLKITIDDTVYTDDGTLDIDDLLAAMRATRRPIQTAAPAPEEYAELMRKADASFVITLSQKLSGSYNAAMAGKAIVLEETPDKQIHIFDSKSAAAGELCVAFYLKEQIQKDLSFNDIVHNVTAFIDSVRTFFVLEDLSTLIKNGRIPRMQGKLGTVLMVRPIMGEDGNGEIMPIEKVRGTRQALNRLVRIVAKKTAHLPAKSTLLTLSYCNDAERGVELKKKLLQECPALYDVIITPTGGLSATYANNGGVILAFPDKVTE